MAIKDETKAGLKKLLLPTAASLAAYAFSAALIFRLYAADRPHLRKNIIFIIALLAGFGPLWEATHLGQINAFVVLCLESLWRPRPS